MLELAIGWKVGVLDGEPPTLLHTHHSSYLLRQDSYSHANCVFSECMGISVFSGPLGGKSPQLNFPPNNNKFCLFLDVFPFSLPTKAIPPPNYISRKNLDGDSWGKGGMMTTYLSLIVLLVGVGGWIVQGVLGLKLGLLFSFYSFFPDWTSSCWDLVLWEEVRLLGGLRGGGGSWSWGEAGVETWARLEVRGCGAKTVGGRRGYG